MNNKNNSNDKQQLLTEKQYLEKEKMLLEMQKEISELENDIKNFKAYNSKSYMLRGLKIALKTGKFIAPFALTAGITFGAYAAVGATPFYRDEHKQKLEMMKELDSLGNVRYEQQYEKYANACSSIAYYSKWNFAENNLYSRDIETYETGNITEETIIKLINGDIKSLREILGEPISKKTETKNNLSEEELQSDSFMQATIYSKFDNDFIIVKETSIDNMILTLAWFLTTLGVEAFPAIYRIRHNFDYSNSYSNSIKKIKREHPILDIKELTKKLEIKKSNYNKLAK